MREGEGTAELLTYSKSRSLVIEPPKILCMWETISRLLFASANKERVALAQCWTTRRG